MQARRLCAAAALLLALAASAAAERAVVALTKADRLQQLLGDHLSAEAEGVFAALERELGRRSRGLGEAGGRGGGRDVDIHPHVAQKEKAMALAQSIEKGGVDAAGKDVAELLLKGAAQKEAVQVNVTATEQSMRKSKSCDKVYKKFLKEKARLLTQVKKVEKKQKKSTLGGKKRQPGLLTLGRMGRAFLGLSSAEEKAKQADPEASCGIAAADHEELKEGLQKVHPCWPRVQQAAKTLEGTVSEEEKQEAFVRLTNIMLSCKEPTAGDLEVGKAAIKAKGGEPEEVAREGALEMQKKAAEAAKLEVEMLDDEDDEDEDEDDDEDDEDDAGESSLLEEGGESLGGAEVAVGRAAQRQSAASEAATSAFAAANSELLAHAQGQVEAAISRLGQLLDSGDDQKAAALARGLLVGDSTRGEAELVIFILGGIFYALVFAMCGGPLILWFLMGWIVCILYKVLSLIVSAGKKLLQLSAAVSPSNTSSASIWGCYTGGLEFLSDSSGQAGGLGCFMMLNR